jgi:glycosyltransferase involved in cell wall biosynthesis
MQKCNFKFEILINDDASTDDTREILEEYQKKYPSIIKPIFHRENQWSKGIRGMNFRFNFCRAQGDYIALCEGDDFWIDPKKLQTQVEFLQNNREYSMTFHSATLQVGNSRDIKSVFSKIENREYSQLEVFKRWIVPTASMCFRKEVITNEQYIKIHQEKELIYGDNLLLVASANIGKLKGFSKIMSVYRKHSEGVSFTIKRSTVEALNNQNLLFARYFPSLRGEVKNLILERYLVHLKIAIKSKNISDFFYYIGRIIKR